MFWTCDSVLIMCCTCDNFLIKFCTHESFLNKNVLYMTVYWINYVTAFWLSSVLVTASD
jgi:hypothetical protein